MNRANRRSRFERRVLIDGTAALSGGRVYLEELLPRLFRALPEWEFIVFGAPEEPMAGFLPSGQVKLERPLLPSPRFSLSLAGLAKLLWREIVFPLRAQRLRPDLVFSTANFFSPLVRAPVVLGLHNLVPFHSPEWYEERGLLRRARTWLLRRLTADSARRARRVIAFSTYAARLLEQRGVRPESIGVVHHGRPPATARWRGARSRSVLLVSHYFRYKKIETALHALARVNRQIDPPVRLVVQGQAYDAEYYRSLGELARTLGVENKVELGLGVSPEALAEYYASSRLLIFPAVGANCPITLLEAMAAGIPILAADCPPVPELCGEAAEMFHLADAGSCARGILRLFVDERRLAELSATGTARAGQFCWDTAAERTAQYLREACCERSL